MKSKASLQIFGGRARNCGKRSVAAGLARFVIPGVPLHMTPRGNSGSRKLFGDDDRAAYFGLFNPPCARAGIEPWG